MCCETAAAALLLGDGNASVAASAAIRLLRDSSKHGRGRPNSSSLPSAVRSANAAGVEAEERGIELGTHAWDELQQRWWSSAGPTRVFSSSSRAALIHSSSSASAVPGHVTACPVEPGALLGRERRSAGPQPHLTRRARGVCATRNADCSFELLAKPTSELKREFSTSRESGFLRMQCRRAARSAQRL